MDTQNTLQSTENTAAQTSSFTNHAHARHLGYEESGHTGFASKGEFADILTSIENIRKTAYPNVTDLPKAYTETFTFTYVDILGGSDTPFTFTYSETLQRDVLSNMENGDVFVKSIEIGQKLSEAYVAVPAFYPMKEVVATPQGRAKVYRSFDWMEQPKIMGFFYTDYQIKDYNRPLHTGSPYIRVTQDYRKSQRFFKAHKGFTVAYEQVYEGDESVDYYKKQYTDEFHPITGKSLNTTGFQASYADHNCLFGCVRKVTESNHYRDGQWYPNDPFTYTMGFYPSGSVTTNGYGLINMWLEGTQLKLGYMIMNKDEIRYTTSVADQFWNIVVYGKKA